ncbi:MAG: adenosylcobinamide-GDP ribazoletransferase [Endomicrobiales bacterium]|jgi:adenosylcobinamide-GDP ribazoletransferase
MNNIITSLALTSRIPLGKYLSVNPDFKKSATHFPLAGYLAFGLFCAAYMPLKRVFHDEVIAKLIALIIVYFFFNIFHFDGFMDSFDGLLSQKPPEKMLEIMRSGSAGPMGVAAGVFYLALKMYLIVKLNIVYLLVAFVVARWAMVFSSVIAKPARPDGLGALLLPIPVRYFALASLYLIPLIIGYKLSLLLPLCIVIACDALIVHRVTRSINGLTGDTLGLITETNELIVLLMCVPGWF